MLANLVHVMEERYELLANAMERNITSYNASPRRTGKPLPFMVVVIDELADLILREGRKVEDPIVKIAQKARAVGIRSSAAPWRASSPANTSRRPMSHDGARQGLHPVRRPVSASGAQRVV